VAKVEIVNNELEKIEKVKSVVEANSDIIERYEVRESFYNKDTIILEVVFRTAVSAIRVNSEFLSYVSDELAEIIDRYNYLASYEVTYSSKSADEIIEEFTRDAQIVRTLNDKQERYYVELNDDAVLEHNSHHTVKLKADRYIIVTTRRIENAYD